MVKKKPMEASEKRQPRMKRRDKNLFDALWQHSHFLRSALTLALDRHRQLDRTLLHLGYSEMPTDDEELRTVQIETAREIGGIRTMMYLDAPHEIMKFHYGPLQVALCLLDAVIARYKKLSRDNPVFQDDQVDGYCNGHADFLRSLQAVRDSLLHERHENVSSQAAFVETFREESRDRIVSSLLEGAATYEAYLRRLASSLSAARHA